MTLTRTAKSVSSVCRHERNITKSARIVHSRIGGVNFCWLSSVTRL